MTLPADAGLDAAIDALPASKGGWVPVLDDRMHVTGIVSSADLIRGWQQTMRQSVRSVAAAARTTTIVEGEVGAGAVPDGVPLSRLPLPPGTIVVSLVRDGSLVFPESGTHLRAGDQVTVLARARAADEVKRVLGVVEAADYRPPAA
jgi:NhaP-type Na+/H+ and K+/H+ antiporter